MIRISNTKLCLFWRKSARRNRKGLALQWEQKKDQASHGYEGRGGVSRELEDSLAS